MGIKQVKLVTSPEGQKEAFDHVIKDLGYLRKMVENGSLDRETTRIGAEQELCLVDAACGPAPVIVEFLEGINDHHFTTEFAKFNLEVNLDPYDFTGDFLSRMEKDLEQFLTKAKHRARELGHYETIMTGILPTLKKMDMELVNLTPNDRARAMIEAMNFLRRKDATLQINGIDELKTMDFSNMFQSCNTSFQVHFQLTPDNFTDIYNFALATAGPLLAACSNSPILFGKRLWHETRIAMFQQTVDTRDSTYHLSRAYLRVPFGENWVKGSVFEIFEDDLSKFRPFLVYNDPGQTEREWNEGKIPNLMNFNVFNSSVFRWFRPCYGITNGKPHLRLENRIIPSGPSIPDEIANTAFWTGLMQGMGEQYKNLSSKMDFEAAKLNLLKAARYGLGTQFDWIGGEKPGARELLLDELLPISRIGLKMAKVEEEDINKYLGIIEERITTGKTGSQWMLDSWKNLEAIESVDNKAFAITSEMINRQKEGKPVHQWEIPEHTQINFTNMVNDTAGKFMSTDLYSVREDDLLEQVAFNMVVNNYHYVPVADEQGMLKGLLTEKLLLHEKIISAKEGGKPAMLVGDIMELTPLTISPSTPVLDAIKLMKEQKVKCLPVIYNGRITGLITEFDIMNIAEFFILKNQENG